MKVDFKTINNFLVTMFLDGFNEDRRRKNMKLNKFVKDLLSDHKKMKKKVFQDYQQNNQKFQNLSLDFEKAKEKYNKRN